MENIRYGRLDATDEEVIAAARAVHADQVVEKWSLVIKVMWEKAETGFPQEKNS